MLLSPSLPLSALVDYQHHPLVIDCLAQNTDFTQTPESLSCGILHSAPLHFPISMSKYKISRCFSHYLELLLYTCRIRQQFGTFPSCPVTRLSSDLKVDWQWICRFVTNCRWYFNSLPFRWLEFVIAITPLALTLLQRFEGCTIIHSQICSETSCKNQTRFSWPRLPHRALVQYTTEYQQYYCLSRKNGLRYFGDPLLKISLASMKEEFQFDMMKSPLFSMDSATTLHHINHLWRWNIVNTVSINSLVYEWLK